MEIQKLNIIDGDTILYICLHNKKDEPEKTLEDCYKSIDLFINNLLEQTQSTHYLLYLTIGKCFRYNINPSYKANRVKLEKPKYFRECKDYLLSNWNALWNNNYESDDLCAFTRTHFTNLGIDCFISSSDKDIRNLRGTTYNYLKSTWEITEEPGANLYFWQSMITGDTADGIKGIPKKGIKFAEKLFEGVEDNAKYLRQLTFDAYTDNLGEYQGVQEFAKNYLSLKILEDHLEGFTIPEPIQWKKQEAVEELFK